MKINNADDNWGCIKFVFFFILGVIIFVHVFEWLNLIHLGLNKIPWYINIPFIVIIWIIIKVIFTKDKETK